jgi:hypothetical protein
MREQVPNPVPEHGGRDVGIMDLSALRAKLVHKLQEQRRHVVQIGSRSRYRPSSS